MSLDDLPFAIELAHKEGWNPGLNDAHCFHEADNNGFLMGVLNGRPIATISAVNYSGIYGFVGLYIVLPQYRGQGYGFALWQAAMKRLKVRLMGLDGVVDQQDNYRKSGFIYAHRNIRYQSQELPLSAASTHTRTSDITITSIKDLPFAQLCNYDRKFFPAPRDAFLNLWFNCPNHHGLVALQQGNIQGLGVIRRCQAGYKIGPLYASTPTIAETLFLTLSQTAAPNSQIYLDVPATNPAAVELAERYNMKVTFETARMYNGAPPNIPLKNLYGITTFELG